MPSNKAKKSNISAGQRRYKFASDTMKDYESYEKGVAEEKKKSGKRSLWTTLGGVVGAGIAIMAAPAIIGAAAGAGLLGAAAAATGAGSLATGIGTAAIVGGGSAFGSKRGMEHSEKKHGRRKNIKTEKFYKKQASDANEAFKQSYRDIDTAARNQAIGSGALAGLQAGGAFKKMGELGKKGLGIGKDTGAVFDPNLVTAKNVGGTSDKLAHATQKGFASPSQASGVGMEYAGPEIFASPYSPTAALGNLSDASLYGTLKKSLGNAAFQHGIAYGTSNLKNNDVQTEEIGFDPSKYYV